MNEWKPGQPIDYSDPNCQCGNGGMGRHWDCRVHGYAATQEDASGGAGNA